MVFLKSDNCKQREDIRLMDSFYLKNMKVLKMGLSHKIGEIR